MSSSTWLNKSTSTDFRINELMLKQEVNNIMASHSIFPDDFPVDVPTRYLSAVLRMYSSHDYECDLSKWIPLNAEMMRKPENAGRRYLEFERRLQEKGLIEKRPNNYLKGKYSCHFRFTSFFVEGLCSLIRLSLLINFKKYEDNCNKEMKKQMITLFTTQHVLFSYPNFFSYPNLRMKNRPSVAPTNSCSLRKISNPMENHLKHSKTNLKNDSKLKGL